jgi:hypothetical protein
MSQENINFLLTKEKSLSFRFFNLSLGEVFSDGRIAGVLRVTDHQYLDGFPDKSNLYYVEIDSQGKIIKSDLVNFKPIGIAGESLMVSDVEDDRSSQDGLLHGVTAVMSRNLWYPAIYYNDCDWQKEICLQVLNNLPPGKNTLPGKHQDQYFFLYRPDSTPYQIWGYYLEKDNLLPKNSSKPDFVWNFLPNWWTKKRVGLVSEGLILQDGREFLPIHGQYADQNDHTYYALGGCLAKIGQSALITPFTNPFLTPGIIEEVVGRKLPQAVPKKTIIYSCGALKNNDNFEIAVSVGDAETFYLKTPWSEMEQYINSQGECLPSWQVVWELQLPSFSPTAIFSLVGSFFFF